MACQPNLSMRVLEQLHEPYCRSPSEKLLKKQQSQLRLTNACLFIRNLLYSACQTWQILDIMNSAKNQMYFFMLFVLFLGNVYSTGSSSLQQKIVQSSNREKFPEKSLFKSSTAKAKQL